MTVGARRWCPAVALLFASALGPAARADAVGPADSSLRRLTRVALIEHPALQTKSLGIAPNGLVFAQNMMYRHNVTVLDADGGIVKVIPDTVDLGAFGVPGRSGRYQGSPVEVAFSPDGTHAYVSNYKMFGRGYRRPGTDTCGTGRWDESFVYRISLATLEIDAVIAVGAVPKFLAVTPDGSRLLVSNWCSHDVSVVDLVTNTEIVRVPVGRHPRGIAVTTDSSTAYVSVMGTNRIWRIDLATYAKTKVPGAGATPRHLVLSPDGHFLYVSNNHAGGVRRIDLVTGSVRRVSTGIQPRSMALSDDGASLYVVNYRSGTLVKVRTADMVVVQKLRTGGAKPVGVAYDPTTRRVWVSNYRGSIAVFEDR